jgi:hypothetical protein
MPPPSTDLAPRGSLETPGTVRLESVLTLVAAMETCGDANAGEFIATPTPDGDITGVISTEDDGC